MSGSTWDQRPFPGEVWQRGRETRTVKDRTLGGDVLYYTGAERKRHYQCPSVRWFDWQSGATQLEKGQPFTGSRMG